MNKLLAGAGLSIAGRTRQHNEDSLLCQPDVGLWVIADGMGGHNRGDLASAIAVQSIHRCIEDKQSLSEAISQANNDIAQLAQGSDERQGMGTTVVALKITGFDYEICWVGDSRAYLIDDTGLQQISRDHSLVQVLIDAGELSPTEAENHPRKNVITRCLGHDTTELQVDSVSGSLQAGQMILLCSDGLTGELSEQHIHQFCSQDLPLQRKVECLVNAANDQGGRDNISCILVARIADGGIINRLRRLFWLN